MKVLVPGHVYHLPYLDADNRPQHVEVPFLRKEQNHHGDTKVASGGVTTEQVLAMLLDRLRILNLQVPCSENSMAITKLQEAGHWLAARRRLRTQQGVEGTSQIHRS